MEGAILIIKSWVCVIARIQSATCSISDAHGSFTEIEILTIIHETSLSHLTLSQVNITPMGK